MNILLFPNPGLREKAKNVDVFDGRLKAFARQLQEFMYVNKGCVGIAAPQVGKLARVIVVDSSGNRKTVKSSGPLALINPVITYAAGACMNREGCLSVPDFTGNVERPDKIRVEYQDADGKKQSLETYGFEAVILQHEIDHLDGVLFIDKIRNSKRDLFKRKSF